MKNYTLQWQDVVTFNVDIEAESEEEALQLFEEGKYDWDLVVEIDSEIFDEAEIIDEEDLEEED